MAYNPLIRSVPGFDLNIGPDRAEYRIPDSSIAVEVAAHGRLRFLREWRMVVDGIELSVDVLRDPHISCNDCCEFYLGATIPPDQVSRALDAAEELEDRLMAGWPRHWDEPEPLDLAATV